MAGISAADFRQANGHFNRRLAKNQGSQKSHDRHIKNLSNQYGAHAKNARQQQLAGLIVLCLSTLQMPGSTYAMTSTRAQALTRQNILKTADTRTHVNNISRAVYREIRRTQSAAKLSEPEAHPAAVATALAQRAVLLPRRVVSKRSVPQRAFAPTSTQAAVVRDDVKIVALPRYKFKKINSFNDALTSLSKGGVKPFTSLADVGNQLYELISGNEVSRDKKKMLQRIGGLIDDITALIPDVNLTRIPFKFSRMIAKPDTPPNADELMGLLNDLNALKSYIRQDTFSVRHAHHRQGKKGTTVKITDRNGKLHTLPVRWYKNPSHPAGGKWEVPLSGYQASKKELLVEQGNGIYSSLDKRDFINIANHFYPVEFIKGKPDNAFVINPNKPTSVPVERITQDSHEWRVVQGGRSKSNRQPEPEITWEHRLASAASSHPLELAQPDVTTGIATLEGEAYIKGNYGVYKVEYNDDFAAYVVKTGDGLDYPLAWNKDKFSWETKIIHTQPHRYTSGKLKKLDNALKKRMIDKELRRREISHKLSYPARPGIKISMFDTTYLFEADGFTALRLTDFKKYTQLMRTLTNAERTVSAAQKALRNPADPRLREVLCQHFAIPESAISGKLINEVKHNVMALHSGLLWLRRCDYSIMTLKNLPGQTGRYDGAYFAEYNKIILFSEWFPLTLEEREDIILHELGHAKITDPEQPWLSTVDHLYMDSDVDIAEHAKIASGDRSKVTYGDGGAAFMRRMKADNMDAAWHTFTTKPKKRIRLALLNPDSIVALTKGLADLARERAPAGDKRRKRAASG